MQPLTGLGYLPVDKDEKGLWQDCAKLESEIASSNRLVVGSALHDYTYGILQRLLGPQAANLRVYVLHDASFNASMAPNGMTIVHTGLLVRLRDEAQYAAVLGHESGHYLRRHSVAQWRNNINKTGAMAMIGAVANAGAGVAVLSGASANSVNSWINTANGINAGLAASMLSFSRDQEEEADGFGVRVMAEAGYPPAAAAAVWQQVIEERKASAAARGKHYHSHDAFLSDHPPDEKRMLDLASSARDFPTPPPSFGQFDAGRGRWLAAIGPFRAQLLEEQVSLNDPGASLYLVNALAFDGWDGTLRFCEGEIYRLRDGPGDASLAATSYAAAVADPAAPHAAWRAHGYGLIKSGRRDEGRAALSRYLELDPGASDALMIRFSLAQ